MAVAPLSVWTDTLKALPKTEDSSFGMNFSRWYANSIARITTDPSGLATPSFSFAFPVPVFAKSLEVLPPVPTAMPGILGFATAWESSILATAISAAPGAPFSSVSSVTIDPPSVAAGKAKLMELASSPPVDDASNSQFSVIFRQATLLLTVTVVGQDNSSSPLTVPGIKLI